MIIGIGHKQQVGKDTAGNYLKIIKPEFEIRKFADPLKEVTSILLNCNRDMLEDIDFKNQILNKEWWYVTDKFGKYVYNIDLYNDDILKHYDNNIKFTVHKPTVRDVLQRTGTDCMRHHFHTDVWVNSLFNRYTPESNWIITDVRFHNEADRIKKLGGIMIKIDRKDAPVSWHESELNLNDYTNWDYVIDNNSSFKDLYSKLELI